MFDIQSENIYVNGIHPEHHQHTKQMPTRKPIKELIFRTFWSRRVDLAHYKSKNQIEILATIKLKTEM